ncbi:MAG: UDP-N-acetylmuramoyl-tripeptide--D-alanyl-D-alanine ligase [Archangium sp.]|nr:UDP-N-acetylmuramoyl-tripeptide--D-alanyl-D-alanine ligase [Archangium sp.]MDP3156316.1 UDP-N-acetylmuramoyl-tripeptide--D-alanyl-D-alanine ligase [Archangium sp.]MDP3570360.1 UDP-N-acetylmuramoyl-tripeptide--D-alanyl-D-alanine ligase [Archangium sp.]
MSARFNDQEVLKATNATKSRVGKALSYESVCTDTRQLTEGCLFVALKGERYDANEFLAEAVKAGAAGLVVNEGRAGSLSAEDVTVYEVKDTLVALGQLARFHRDRFNIPLCAVTGSNGKTTTKELVASILSMRGPTLKTHGNLNNEIGVPLTLFGLDQTHVAAVIEMGMNHLGEIARLTEIARPDAGLITIVQPAHLEGVGSIEGVAKAKAELFHGLSGSSIAVVNLDDHRIAHEAASVSAKKLTWGRAAEADVRLLSVEPQGRDGLSLRIGSGGKEYSTALHLVGDHNAMNATGAFALAIALGYSPEECVRGLEAAQAHARRLQILDAPNGVTVIDDCYNANPASMNAALRTVAELASEGRAVAVLGDMLELGSAETHEHTQLGVAASDRVALLALFGPRTKLAHVQAVKKLGAKVKHFEDVGELVAWLRQELLPNDYVLVKGSRGMRLERVVEALTGTTQGGGH